MAKRFQPMKEFGRTSKKPKLDISINKKNYNARDNLHAQQPLPQSNADLWDDDEDDVILLATQAAESTIAARNNQTITESEITFSEFQPRVQQHSTQRQTEPQIDLLSQMFDDDDDFVRLAAAAEKESQKYVPTSAQLFSSSSAESMVFKKPELPSGSKAKTNGPTNQQSINLSQNTPTQTDPSVAARRQLAAERQVQFLMERLEVLKQENAKINKDLEQVKDNMQLKSGEASVLRDELRRSKQQIDNLKMEKLLQTESANAESKLKIEQLAKEVKTKETQLQLKNMECSVLKMRQVDESRRLEMSMRETFDDNKKGAESSFQTKTATKTRSVAEVLSMLRLRDLTIKPLPRTIESNSALLTKDAFERADERGVSKKFNTFFQQELENVQLILAQLQLNPHTFDTEMLIESVRKVFSEFWSYTHSLDYKFYEKVQPYHDYDVMADKSQRTSGCLLLKASLYARERGLNLRRYIAALSAVCQQSEVATRLLLQAKHEDYPLIQIAIDAIVKLGFSEEISAHFGIIEAFAVVMRNMLLHLKPDLAEDKESFDLIFPLLKYLVFTRPNPWALYELSFCVLDCALRSLPILTKCCENSQRRHFEADRSKSVCRFTNDACFLQVYCGLMESTYPLYRLLSKTQFELQTKICLNHVRFVFNCLTEPPHFVQKELIVNDENEESSKSKPATNTNNKDNRNLNDETPSTSKQAIVAATLSSENSSNSNSSLNNTPISLKPSTMACDCFTQMCLSVVTMVWLTLRQWLRTNKDVETERVGLISRISVHLFYVMFCDNYRACLFREDEETTKHQFYLICTWWQENATEFQFSNIQLQLLQKLMDSRAMPKMLKDEETKLDNITADLEQWRRMTNDQACDLTLKNSESIIKNLRLFEDAFDPDIFLASRNKSHLQIKTFDD